MLFKQEVYYTDLRESLLADIASVDGKYLENFKVKKGTFHDNNLQTHYQCRIQQKNKCLNQLELVRICKCFLCKKNRDHAKRWESKITWQCSECTACIVTTAKSFVLVKVGKRC